MSAKTARQQMEIPFPPVKANPSKDIFIRMLTKDLSLTDAILDLADNSVDGARRMKKRRPAYDGYFIHIEFSNELFRITDNCGGIAVDVAENYAFRFGKPEEREPEPGMIGEFGVGMKRAVFKMGTQFRVESTTTSSHFVIDEDVEKWRDKKNWAFHFKEYQPALSRVAKERIGTRVEVRSLHEEIASEFASSSFRRELERRLQDAHQHAISLGLTIKVVDVTLPSETITLMGSPKIQPGYFQTTLNGSAEVGEEPINIRLFAGISESEPSAAGWYIYCNGRQIVAADQTSKTGWGEVGDINLPKMHNQFSRFRGYAFFDCRNQSRLPWTTTKQGIDVESYAYKKVRPEMVRMTRPVITFLNRLDQEKDLGATPIGEAVSRTKAVALAEIMEVREFDAQSVLRAQVGRKLARIVYTKPADVVDIIKEHIDATTNAEVGQTTFDYYCEYEEIDVD